MATDPTFAKMIGIIVLGSAVKKVFGPPPAPVTNVYNHPEPATKPELEIVPQEDN